jgi:hypothetical protein
VKSGPAASTANSRTGQRAEAPHSAIASEPNSIAETTVAATTSGTFPTTAAGR